MPKISAGLLMYRIRDGVLQVFLVHPGGPFWTKKDLGAWSIPKGMLDEGEDPLEAALREFEEETGIKVSGRFIPLAPLKQKSGKVIQAWAFEGDCDPSAVRSNTFSMEWPTRSSRYQEFPEIDRAEWFEIQEAGKKIHRGQMALLTELQNVVIKGGKRQIIEVRPR